MQTPTTFRKKPVDIQAMQWTAPEQAAALVAWAASTDPARPVHYDPNGPGPVDPATGDPWGRLSVQTLETGDDPHLATPGDWLIRGVKGEFYFCKPDIFEATYDRVA